MEKLAVVRVHLIEMPFDAFDDVTRQFIHATGDRVLLSDGIWYTEYEDNIFTDAPNVKELWERDWEE